MNYYLFKLKLLTPVHFGDSESSRSLERSLLSFGADTLFSGLCHVAIKIDADNGIKQLVREVSSGNILLSDGMPYFGDSLYVPKPFLKQQRIVNNIDGIGKELKRLSYVPIIKLKEFTEFTKGGAAISPSEYGADFGIETVFTRASIKGEEQTRPYSVGAYSFKPEAGLYIIAGYQNEESLEYLKRLVALLGLSGIGGKTSSGYGRFEIVDEIYLDEPFDLQTEELIEMLTSTESNAYISITTALPREDEMGSALRGSFYGVVRRGGFVCSENYAERPFKKKTQYFFKAGSVFQNTFEGDVYDVSSGGSHPCYRYAKPIFLGVRI